MYGIHLFERPLSRLNVRADYITWPKELVINYGEGGLQNERGFTPTKRCGGGKRLSRAERR